MKKYRGSTRRFQLFTTDAPLVPDWRVRKSTELADKPLNNPGRQKFFSIKKRGKRYIGLTNFGREWDVGEMKNLIHQHELEHVREVAFLDKFGFRRNSNSMLAHISEPFFATRKGATYPAVPFDEIYELCKSPKKRALDWVDPVVFGTLSHFPGSKRTKLLVSIFRSPKLRRHLEYLNTVSWFNKKNQKLKITSRALLQIVRFAEKQLQSSKK